MKKRKKGKEEKKRRKGKSRDIEASAFFKNKINA